jgi:hypothetical protein
MKETDKGATTWAMIFLAFFGALLLMPKGYIWWSVMPLWIMAGAELMKKDYESRNLIKLMVFGLLPFGCLASTQLAPYLIGLMFWFWAIFIFIERPEPKQEIDVVVSMPVIFGLLCMLIPEYVIIFVALQYAIYGIILLWKGEL